MWKRLTRLFKKQPLPNLNQAVKHFEKLAEEMENCMFYLSLVKDHKLTEDEKMYLTRASYNVSSIRDELQLSNRKQKEEQLWKTMNSK